MTCLGQLLTEVLQFLWHISPALVGVILGGFLLQRFFISKANEASLIDSLTEEIEEIRADSLEYWNLSGSTPKRQERAKVLEQKIKGGIKSLVSDLNYYKERYGRAVDFNALMGEVSDACTGGSFESKDRKPDSQRYILVVNTLNRVKSELRRQKI